MFLKELVELMDKAKKATPKFYGSKPYRPKGGFIDHTRIDEPYPVPKDAKEITIEYENNVWTSEKIVFIVK